MKKDQTASSSSKLSESGHRIQAMQETSDARRLPSRSRCLEVLEQSNQDCPRWTCPVCNESGSRAHWIAEHVIHHLDFPRENT
jgi:hypothetical protein